ncbi:MULTISPECIES: hypothetical protein [Pseudomonas]|uniref:Uncharacterized protein n=1 Tax=Pseudomonas aphyarum TaxID=2942629 RepID=A0ABT5PH82_9PSED|nr:hypothetical protein [Pseudomonas aphyarum]MDD0967921.1 hypothetical protein [Pseudomonas aphyarum]MDD1123232.1 hypothetical protein [Pseudomonas aphyarum]
MDTSADVYIVFIKHVEALVDHGITVIERKHLRDDGGLRETSRKVIDRLRSSSAKVAIANAFAQLEPEIEDALVGELMFVIDNIEVVDGDVPGEVRYAAMDADEHDTAAASAAKTGKDSLESILEKWLPKWLKNRLKILNEILSIVFKV